jgi:hypothetical protein
MTAPVDPLGLVRCADCGNALEFDRLPSGDCRICGGRFDPRPAPMPAEPVYAVLREQTTPNGDGEITTALVLAEFWPRTLEGVITATDRAAWLSVAGGPHEVHRPDGRMIARYVLGRRDGLPPGGIIHLADERAAEGR